MWLLAGSNGTNNLPDHVTKILKDIKMSPLYIQGSLNKFPDFFHMGTFIDSTHMKTVVPFEVISFGCNALVVPFQQLLARPNESPLVWVCQWPSSQPLSCPQLSHQNSL